jgi:hypothetical protein
MEGEEIVSRTIEFDGSRECRIKVASGEGYEYLEIEAGWTLTENSVMSVGARINWVWMKDSMEWVEVDQGRHTGEDLQMSVEFNRGVTLVVHESGKKVNLAINIRRVQCQDT